jgi:tRNA-dihydrouridine synthase A
MSEVKPLSINRTFSVAPMLDWTDRHDRYFLRLISKHALLYTEMITTGALIHGDRQRYLQFNAEEHPVAIQLGGSEPADMALCAKMAEDEGYDEININVGCPSDRVQRGSFGACLMAEPNLVAECVSEMQNKVDIPVTVKSRIGIDNKDSYEALHHFIDTLANAGCQTFIIHARKAWLQGLSPKENRDVPPLRYDWVYQIKQDFPTLEIIINGGITTLDACDEHLQHVDGVMVGREAYHNPYLLATVDQRYYGATKPLPTRKQVLEAFCDYVQQQRDKDVYLKHMSRHILGLFQGMPGAKAWRRKLSENAHKPGAGITLLQEAASLVDCD